MKGLDFIPKFDFSLHNFSDEYVQFFHLDQIRKTRIEKIWIEDAKEIAWVLSKIIA